MKNTKERKPSPSMLLARAEDQFARAMDRVGNLEKQRDTLASQMDDADRRFRALLWALELAHKENRELRARLAFLQSPGELAKRDPLALAS